MSAAQDKPKTVTAAGLKARGWTPGMVTALLGDPDARKINPRYANAAPMRLYDTARVETAEQSPEFAATKAKAASRQAGAAKAVDTKRTALLKQISEMDVNVSVRSIDAIKRSAIYAYNCRNIEGVSRDAPTEFLERIMVNFIRHNLTTYDESLDEIAGRVGIDDGVQMIRRKVYGAIAAGYPALAHECERQMAYRGVAS